MIVTADQSRRITLPGAKPGDRFDVALQDGKYVLAPLLPVAVRRVDETELLRRTASIKWTTHLTPEEARGCVMEGRA